MPYPLVRDWLPVTHTSHDAIRAVLDGRRKTIGVRRRATGRFPDIELSAGLFVVADEAFTHAQQLNFPEALPEFIKRSAIVQLGGINQETGAAGVKDAWSTWQYLKSENRPDPRPVHTHVWFPGEDDSWVDTDPFCLHIDRELAQEMFGKDQTMEYWRETSEHSTREQSVWARRLTEDEVRIEAAVEWEDGVYVIERLLLLPVIIGRTDAAAIL